MTFSEIQKQHSDVLSAVLLNRLKDGLEIISKLLIHVSSSDIHNRYQSLTDTYKSMLKYSFELAPDPEREGIHMRLKQSIIELSDETANIPI